MAHTHASTTTTTSSSSLKQRPPHKKQYRLPASYYRGGTSRALIFSLLDLPSSRSLWAPIFLSVLGSPDPNGRQLDGMGGGISSLSKICVVGKSEREDADVDYTFVAVGVRDNEVDFTANCGNMTSAVGPWAVERGWIDLGVKGEGEGGDGGEEMVTVRIYNTNTGKIIHVTFPVVDGEASVDGDFAIDGVAGTGAKIELAFVDPAGSKTGKLLPTGNTTDTFDGIRATCIDAGNPCVFIQATDLNIDGAILPDAIDAHPTLLCQLNSIRRKASVAMGLSVDEASTSGSIPKIAIVSRPKSHKLLSGEVMEREKVDVVVRALSVGQPHKAVPVTVAMAIAAAADVKGSVVQRCVDEKRVDKQGLTVGHSSGKILVGSRFDEGGKLSHITVYRTARRLMEGMVYWK